MNEFSSYLLELIFVEKGKIAKINSAKISALKVGFSRRKKYNKNRSNFPGERSQNFVRTDTIFQETIPLRTDIYKIASSDAFATFTGTKSVCFAPGNYLSA